MTLFLLTLLSFISSLSFAEGQSCSLPALEGSWSKFSADPASPDTGSNQVWTFNPGAKTGILKNQLIDQVHAKNAYSAYYEKESRFRVLSLDPHSCILSLEMEEQVQRDRVYLHPASPVIETALPFTPRGVRYRILLSNHESDLEMIGAGSKIRLYRE